MTNTLHPRIARMLNAYRLYFNFYADDDQLFDTLDEFASFPDIAATITATPIDDESLDDARAIHLYFDYDTCAINLLATFDMHDMITTIMLSTDTMPYESMICDIARRP